MRNGKEPPGEMVKRKIAHFIATNFYGGPERQIINNALRLLEGSGFDPLIISFREGGVENQLLAKAAKEKIQHVQIEAQGPFNPLAIYELIRIIKHYEIDILLCHGFKANTLGRLATAIAGIPMIAVSRGWTAENRKIRFYEFVDKTFLHFANHIVAVSDGQKKKLLALKLPDSKVTVIHNAIDVNAAKGTAKSSIRKLLGAAENTVLVASAGRLSPEKDYMTLVEAARLVVTNNQNIMFCVFGEGACRSELEAKIKEYNLENHFYLPGFRRDLLAVLSEIDLFVLPSLTEGLPNVILEAYAESIPVVATNVGGNPEIISSEDMGVLLEPGDTHGLAEVIVNLASNSDKRKDMGKKGLKVICDCFDYGSQTEKYIHLFDEVLSRAN